MPTANIQIKKVLVGRGNTAVNNSHTGVRGEITMDTGLNTLRIHDGVQTGGHVMAGRTWVQQYVANAALGNVDLTVYGFATQSNLAAFATYANANAAVQATTIANLYANAATQATAISNINSKMMVVGAVAPTGVEGAEWFNTDDGRTYVYTANLWVDANPTVAPAPSFYLGNLTVTGDTINFTNGDLTIDENGDLLVNGSLVQGGGGGSNYGNANVASYLPVYGGNVLAGNILSSTGALGLSANAAAPSLAWTLTTNAFGAGSSALIAPASDDQHQGEIIFPGANGAGFGALAWAGNIGSPFDNSLLVAGLLGNVNIGTQDGITGYYWKFGTDGNLQLPVANASAVLGDTFGDGGITLQSPEQQYAELGAFDGNAYIWVADQGYYPWENGSAVYISTDYKNADHRWAFDPTGTTIVPGPVIVPAGNSALGMIFSTNRGTTVNGRLSVNNDNRMTVTSGGGFAVEIGGNPRFVANIMATEIDSGQDMVFKSNTAFGGDHVMTFAANGDLAVPGNITGTGQDVTITADAADYVFYANANLVLPDNATITFANGVNILDTITGVTSISSAVTTSIWSDASGDYQYGTLGYSYAVNGNNGQFAIEYSFPLVHGNVDVNVGNVIASSLTLANIAVPAHSYGAPGDTAGMIRVDSNYIYYCTSTYVPNSYTVGWDGAISNSLFILKGAYPTPQVGWTVSQGIYTFTIDSVTDNGSNWALTYTGIPYGSPQGGTAVLTNPVQPDIWVRTVWTDTNW